MVIAKERPQSILVILRRCYLNITGNHCAAKLIEYFKHWREWKLKRQRTEWVYMPIKWIHQDLMGEHSVHVIRKAIALLLELKILSHRHNPDNGQDKTWQYRLNLDVLENLTGHFASRGNPAQASVLTDVSGECNSAHSSVETEQTYTQDLRQISKPQQTAVVEENDKTPEDTYTQIRRVSSNIQLNRVVKSAIGTYRHNFPAALERVKRALEKGWCKDPTALLVASLKQGVPEEESTSASHLPQPTEQQLEQLKHMGRLLYQGDLVCVVVGNEAVPWNVLLEENDQH